MYMQHEFINRIVYEPNCSEDIVRKGTEVNRMQLDGYLSNPQYEINDHDKRLLITAAIQTKKFLCVSTFDRMSNVRLLCISPFRTCSCPLIANEFTYTVETLLPNKCAKCFKCPLLPQKTNSLENICSDILLLIRGGLRNEQQTKSRVASWFKLFIERNEKFHEVRRLIHYGNSEQLLIHERFNKHCHLMGTTPADIWVIIGLLAATSLLGVAIYKILSSQNNYEQVIAEHPIISSCDAHLFYSSPNVTENAVYISVVPENCPEAVIVPNHLKMFRDLITNLDAPGLADRNRTIEQNNAQYKGDGGHLVSNEARTLATCEIRTRLTGPYIEFGARRAELVNQPVLMISNRFDVHFEAVNDVNSVGIYASYNL